MKRNWWLFASAGGLIISIVTLFLPVIRYQASDGQSYTYNLVTILNDPHGFLIQTLSEYTGDFLKSAPNSIIVTLILLIALLGVAAIVFSIIGIITLHQQKPNIGPFILALVGLIWTAIPAVALFAMLLLSRDYFQGTMSIGAYAVVTPLAMILALVAITYKRRATLEERRAMKLASQYIYEPSNFD